VDVAVDTTGLIQVLDSANDAVDRFIRGGQVVVTLDSIPDDDQDFGFTTGGGLLPGSLQLDDNHNSADSLLNRGTAAGPPGSGYSITEDVPAGWVLAGKSCSNGSSPRAIDLAVGEVVQCTWTNRRPGRIFVVENTVPDEDQNFSYTAGGGLSPTAFELADDGDDETAPANLREFVGLQPGSGYSITQATPDGWSEPDVQCSPGSTPAGITVRDGETVTCTWVNRRLPAVGDYTFPDNLIRPVGNASTVFDWTTDKCETVDIPDNPARAFRDGTGTVQLLASHLVTRRAVGPDIESVQHQCAVSMDSPKNEDPSVFADFEWLSSPYVMPDGITVMSLLHDEYQGSKHPGHCPSGDYFKCWYNALALGVSHDRGATYTNASAPPSNLVAAIPYVYTPDAGPSGLRSPSNIIRRSDNRYYAMLAASPTGAQRGGTCVIRTSDLSDPKSWRAWNGTDWSTTFVNPYTDSFDPAAHVCAPVSVDLIGEMTASLTYSTYLHRYVLLAPGQFDPVNGVQEQPGFYWSMSQDLIHWSAARRFMNGPVPWSHKCSDPDVIQYPSLIDPNSSSPNFETIGSRADLFFSVYHYSSTPDGGCFLALDRDLRRVTIQFDRGPDCSKLVATPDVLPSFNRNLFPVTISGGASNLQGEPVTTAITAVTQSQPVTGPGDTRAPDAARGGADNQVLLRAESTGGSGRVYHVSVKVADTTGASCAKTLPVAIPRGATDTGATYDSFASG
jgi:hypothetical protein